MEDIHIQKIDFAQNGIINAQRSQSLTVNNMAKTKRRNFLKSRKGKVALAVIAIFLLSSIYMAVKTFAIYNDAQKTYAQAKVAVAAAKQQNVVLAKDELVKTQNEVDTLQKDINSLRPLGFIPFLGGYYNDGRHLVNAADHGLSAAIIATDSIIPYADVLGLKGESTFAGSAQDRIRLAVKTLGKVVPKIDDIEKEVNAAKAEVDEVDPNRYPNFWKFKKIREQIVMVKDLSDQGVQTVNQGKPLIKVLPQLLGESEPKHYLVIFQNDKELRPTGGFMTFYSIFKVEEGNVTVDSSSDIYNLDDSIPSHPAAPYIISEYLPKVNQWFIRDTNLSPDFQESMNTFNKFYKTSSAYKEVDGIIAIDTHFLVSVLNVLGEVEAGGQKFNAQDDPRCDCPQAVYILEDNTTRPVAYIKSNRKGLLGDLLYATMQKALSSSPKEYWGPLVQAAMKDATDKHILFYLYDADAQKGIEALNWGGRVKSFDGDYLHINDANLGGAKSNLFVRSKVRLDYEVKNGEITKTVKIDYENKYPHSDCGLESGGLCLNARLRDFQRLYVPQGSTLVSSKGAGKIKTKEELGKTYYEGFFYVDPKGRSIVTYTYKLPFKVEDNRLPVLIQKQPGTYDVPYEVYVNGKLVDSFNLESDKEMELKI